MLAKFAIMKSGQQMRVMIQPVGGTQQLIKVMAVIARRGFLFRPLADDAQLFPAWLDDLGQYLLQIHRFPISARLCLPCLHSSRPPCALRALSASAGQTG